MDTPVTVEVNALLGMREDRASLVARLEAKAPSELVVLLPYFFSTGSTGAELDALRATITAIIERHLTSEMVQAVNQLNASTTRLTKVGWVLSAVIAGASILVPLYLKH